MYIVYLDLFEPLSKCIHKYSYYAIKQHVIYIYICLPRSFKKNSYQSIVTSAVTKQ